VRVIRPTRSLFFRAPAQRMLLGAGRPSLAYMLPHMYRRIYVPMYVYVCLVRHMSAVLVVRVARPGVSARRPFAQVCICICMYMVCICICIYIYVCGYIREHVVTVTVCDDIREDICVCVVIYILAYTVEWQATVVRLHH
jgi:hypothetical protein